MFRAKPDSDEDPNIGEFVDQADNLLSGVNVDGQFFGDASLMTGIAFPRGIKEDDEGEATANAVLIQAAIDGSGPGTTIRLPNFRFYCDQINIPATKPGLIIEGGGQTLILNKAGVFPNNRVVFWGFSDRIADSIGMAGFLPGTPDLDTFTATDVTGGSPLEFVVGDVMYYGPPFFEQHAIDSRYAEMSTVIGVDNDPVNNEAEVTIADDISTTLAATKAEATLIGDAVDAITITRNYGAAYYSYFHEGAIHHPQVTIEEPPSGTPATAEVQLDAELLQFYVTNRGSGYDGVPTVMIDPDNGATATAILVGDEVDRIEIVHKGLGFARSPQITLDSGSPAVQATAVVTIGPSLIDEIEVTNGGSGYMTEPNVTIDPPPFHAKWVKGGTKVLSYHRETVTLDPPERATEENYPVDSVVWTCTGPAFNDADGHFFRVRAHLGNGKIQFYQTVRPEDFREGLTCLVPGPFIERLTIRNLQIGALDPAYATLPSILLSGVYDLTVENVQMVRGDDDPQPSWLYFTKTQFVRIKNYEGLVDWQTSHNCSIEDSRLMGLMTHSNASDFTIQRCRIGGNVRPWLTAERFTFRDCVFAQSGPIEETQRDDFTAKEECTDLVFENCSIQSMGWPWELKVNRLRMSNMQILDGIVIVRPESQNCILENVRADNGGLLYIDPGSTGRLSNVTPDPGPIDGWFNLTPWTKFPERTAPSTVEEDSAVVFVRDNGSGRTELCVLFNSGGVQQIAIEPPPP